MFHHSKNFLNRIANSTIDTFDIFGQLPNFRVLEKNKYTSVVGCCMTFIIGTATLIYLITEITTLLHRSEPKVVSSELQIFDSTSFPLYNDNFTLAVTIATKNSEPILGQLKYYNLTMSHCVRERLLNQTTGKVQVSLNCSPLPIAPCVTEDFDNDLQKEFFKSTRLGVVQCINRTRLKNNPPVQFSHYPKVLQGQISGFKYQYLVIELSICKNNTDYQGCAPIEEIKKVLSAGHYSVYASDYLMQLNHPDTPYSQFINLDINSFSISTSKMLQWTYRISETHTDNGLLFTTDNVDLNLIKQDRREYTELYNDDYLVYHYIQLDYKQTIQQRSYIKIQTILSKIGGIWQLFMIIASLILNQLINNLMTISIANELYRFPITEKQRHQNIEIINLQQSDQVIDVQEQIKKNRENNNEERLSSGIYESLLILLGIHKKKKKMFTDVKQDILSQMDVVKIIQKLQEVDLLKFILLNDEQYKMFDLLPKPIFQDEKLQMEDMSNEFCSEAGYQKTFRAINHNKKLQSKNLKDYYCSFSSLQQDKRRSSVDDKLLSMIDRNIVQFFEQIQLSQQRQGNLSPLDPLFRSRIDESIIEPKIQRPK
ncbi:unnamed protein product [Paramecium octaurelia]|uniref:Transmembrane protein n=1 Tax=Paramecium octaurelia TaxID=43137 RepID=A0A8S1UH90_PAROT|nr:unnamed protein product [Paramecium octaurelia]